MEPAALRARPPARKRPKRLERHSPPPTRRLLPAPTPVLVPTRRPRRRRHRLRPSITSRRPVSAPSRCSDPHLAMPPWSLPSRTPPVSTANGSIRTPSPNSNRNSSTPKRRVMPTGTSPTLTSGAGRRWGRSKRPTPATRRRSGRSRSTTSRPKASSTTETCSVGPNSSSQARRASFLFRDGQFLTEIRGAQSYQVFAQALGVSG